MMGMIAIAHAANSDVTGPTKTDQVCLALHCGLQLAAAILDPEFMLNSICELGCDSTYESDTTPEKLVYQNCTTTCAVTHESQSGDAFLACAMDHNCIEFPPIPEPPLVPFCPYTKDMVQPDSSLASLTGEWWQHRGKNALWDCYPCQHIHSMSLVDDADWCAKTTSPVGGAVKAPCFNYSYSYDLYQTDGTTAYFGQTWQLPADSGDGNPIDIYYNYMGSWHNETWYLLQATENYVLLGDCSYMMTWIDVGSIVWVRPGHVLEPHEEKMIKSVYYNKLGWNFDDFCVDVHDSPECHTAPTKVGERIPAPPNAFRRAPSGGRRLVIPVEHLKRLGAVVPQKLVV